MGSWITRLIGNEIGIIFFKKEVTTTILLATSEI
jgi:hypothetical protein